MMKLSVESSDVYAAVPNPLLWSAPEWAEADTQMMVVDDDQALSPTTVQAASKVLEQWLSDGQHEPHQRSDDGRIDCEVPYNPVTPCDSSASLSESSDDGANLSLMELDKEIGNNLLGDEVFGVPSGGEQLHLGCSLPTPTFEESTFVDFSVTMNPLSALNESMSDDDRLFLEPLLEDSTTTTMDYDAGFVTTNEACPSSSSPSPILNQERYQEIFKKLEASMKRSQETRKSLLMKTSKTKKYTRRDSVTGVLSSIESSSRQLQSFMQTVQQMKRNTA